MAVALSISHSFHTKNISSILYNKPNSRLQLSVSCQSRGPAGPTDSKEGGDEEKGEKKKKPWVLRIYGEVGKLGEGLKESLSPKRKGDWKDVMLMSLSFAVYVYISQKIVCAYCAWMAMLKHP
ncbi:uncharacterized protein LOC131222574 [Magnolia sinica]|uniref:uncharacterized protein LOC131222574 n=1 Tax=Magnolia sinica TaxID=86752 RepID=UPI00265925FC|nr:uncharacterized protein LOC131222574 [Magnolia sinica]